MIKTSMFAAALLLSAGIATPGQGASADQRDCPRSLSGCGADEKAAYVELLDRPAVLGLPDAPDGAKSSTKDADPPRYEYLSLPDCPENDPNGGRTDIMCSRALTACPPELTGNLRLNIWQRLVAPPAEPTRWTSVGVTCHSDIAPGARPRLSMADLKAEFLRTPWAQPTIKIEPRGEVTLVNLTTFYSVAWSKDGYQPGEARSRTLLGIPVQLRPRLIGFRYDFGDGARFGPTTSAGGGYPDGEVVHTYREPGIYSARVVTTLGAEFSVDGGASWDRIPATVDVPGPPTDITVKEAKAVLVR